MKGNANPPGTFPTLNLSDPLLFKAEKCLLKMAPLSLIRRNANTHGAALLSTSGCLTSDRCTQVDKNLLITTEVAPDKSKGPG